MTAFYNEIDPYAAAWLRNLIAAGHIAPGVVDERSIEDITPEELYGYTQCHFFAGIGVWSLALRAAGWRDEWPIWTGSCPCQPFSAAGKGAGFDDERHLWPAFKYLIRECQPPIVLGEQVASKDVDTWIDLVHADLEALDYAFGSVPFPSAGVGAPHIRDRNYWVAHAEPQRQHGRGTPGAETGARGGRIATAGHGHAAFGLGDTDHARLEGQRGGHQAEGGRIGAVRPVATAGESGGLGNATGAAGERYARGISGAQTQVDSQGRADGCVAVGSEHAGAGMGAELASPTNGFWRDADWLGCRDGKWRPVKPGTFPLAHGAAARVGRLRAYGNAINAEAARVWIETVMESIK